MSAEACKRCGSVGGKLSHVLCLCAACLDWHEWQVAENKKAKLRTNRLKKMRQAMRVNIGELDDGE